MFKKVLKIHNNNAPTLPPLVMFSSKILPRNFPSIFIFVQKDGEKCCWTTHRQLQEIRKLSRAPYFLSCINFKILFQRILVMGKKKKKKRPTRYLVQKAFSLLLNGKCWWRCYMAGWQTRLWSVGHTRYFLLVVYK